MNHVGELIPSLALTPGKSLLPRVGRKASRLLCSLITLDRSARSRRPPPPRLLSNNHPAQGNLSSTRGIQEAAISEDILLQATGGRRMGDTEGSYEGFWGFSYSRLPKTNTETGLRAALLRFMAAVCGCFAFVQNFFKKPSVLHLRLRREGAIGWGRGLVGRSGQRSPSLLSSLHRCLLPRKAIWDSGNSIQRGRL